eukprot:TRINITY_DN2448_c0_g1_i2.p1 TRINITY_DN2448_c0_g1~~TRINITY_DN2448_c0_g1_i2.p1  ORF type:complete len:1092 (+),score=529.70 TRINITY_DN2448_c0_g1_i2:141-3278(+)
MEEELYDEFGNYIGPEIEDDDGDNINNDDNDDEEWLNNLKARDDDEDDVRDSERLPLAPVASGQTKGSGMQIVLHEDKKFFPSAEEVFGPDVEALVELEDTQPLSEPIVAPKKIKKIGSEDNNPAHSFSVEFLSDLMEYPELIRHVSVIGAIHHGKTILLDCLIQQTHEKKWNLTKNLRYTDTLNIEQDREVSIKATPISLVLPNVKGKSFLINLMDTPGHVNFSDEVSAALRLSDGVLLVVDAAEGVTLQTERLVKQAVMEQQAITLYINKIDRLILELKLPPDETYFKLRYIIDQVNELIATYKPLEAQQVINSTSTTSSSSSSSTTSGAGSKLYTQPKWLFRKLSPEIGNVCFGSSAHGWSFSLLSFAQMYVQTHGNCFPVEGFAKRLWGDIWWDAEEAKFVRKVPANTKIQRTFVDFILQPIYKLYSQVLAEEGEALAKFLLPLGIELTKEQYKLDTIPLLKLVLSLFFGKATGLADMIEKFVPSPLQAAPIKVAHVYSGAQNGQIANGMIECRSDSAKLMIQIAKLFARPDGSGFDAFGRIYSGRLHANQTVRVLGESYTVDDEEDMVQASATDLWVSQARYRIPLTNIPAGNWVLIGGVDDSIIKTSTITDVIRLSRPSSSNGKKIQDDGDDDDEEEPVHTFRPLVFNNLSIMKIAVEPLSPGELPKMLDSMRKINKSYPAVITKAEESGEHVILGTGELYLDCVLHDLRSSFSDIEVKVADPVVSFCETVVETSVMRCFASTPNGHNKLTMIAEPLDKGIAEDIERGVLRLDTAAFRAKTIQNLKDKYEWDALAARSLWAFGPDNLNGPNVLVDDSLPAETNKSLLAQIRSSVVQGFQWGTREGPLCEEPIRNVKFKLLDASIASEPILRGSGQIIPTSRRVVYSSFLLATPRLMEPVYFVDIQAPEDCAAVIYDILARRRGHVSVDNPIAGTPLYGIRAFIPAIDSFGFETDLRTHTHGQAFCQMVFDHWNIVPGDPLDKSIVLNPLQPSPAPHLAREFLVKTRRRKGLSEDVSINRFFDEQMLSQISSDSSLPSSY